MAIVVSDTSPIRALEHLRLVGLLSELFGSVFVPSAVERELLNPPAGLPVVQLSQYPFVTVRAPADVAAVERFREQKLDPGESEGLALALELKADLVLIDERAGRLAAAQAGITPLGLLGVLVRAKGRGLVAAVGPLVDRLRLEIDFFVTPELRAEVLRLAGEGP